MAPEPRQVAADMVRSLREAGHVAYFAGGCVRDELLGLHPKDYDVATDATPERVKSIFGRVREVGRSFGVMLVHRRGVTVEVTTFRREGAYSDKRRPDDIEFCDAKTDAKRRDFTINALFIDPFAAGEGAVIDYVGGRRDLDERVLRAVGDPDRRLSEDHLRALRAVRFASRLQFEIEPATRDAIVRHASELAGVSRERIGEEMRMMLRDPQRAAAARLMQQLGLDAPVLEEPTDPGAPTAALASLPAGASVSSGLGAWALDRARGELGAIDAQDLASRWRRALCLSNQERDSLLGMLELAQRLRAEWESLGVARRKRVASSPHFAWAITLVGAADPGRREAIARDLESLGQGGADLAPEPLVTGDDLVESGFEPGPRFKSWLDLAYDAQLEGRISSKEQALALIRELARGVDPG